MLNLIAGQLFVDNLTKIEWEKVLKILYINIGWNMLEHARVSPNSRDVIRQRVSRNIYESRPKHIMEMTQVQLFNKFKEYHCGINMSITTFCATKDMVC